MTVLVAYASFRSSTIGVASQIADRLRKSGFNAVIGALEEIGSVKQYDAVVLGSAVHDHAWLPAAAGFLNEYAEQLAKLPVWLFSVSSVDDALGVAGPKPSALIRGSRRESETVTSARRTIHFRDHRHFAGTFERGRWSVLGDLFSNVCGGSSRDPRDWRDINEWTARITRDLQRADHLKERRRLHLSVRGRP